MDQDGGKPAKGREERIAEVIQARIVLRSDEATLGEIPTVVDVELAIHQALTTKYGARFAVTVAGIRTDR